MLTALWANAARAADLNEPDRELKGAPASHDEKLSGYLSVGGGVSNVGPTARGLVTLAKGAWFAAINVGYGDEFNLFSGPTPSLEQKDAGVIAGLRYRGNFYVGSIGLGLGYVHSVNRGTYLGMRDGLSDSHPAYERIERSGVGVPMAAQAILYLGPVGLGALLFANLNATLPSVGLAGTVNIGRF